MRHLGKKIMKPLYKNLILGQKLFEGCDGKATENLLLSDGVLLSFRSGEKMKPEFSPAVGILLSGSGVICSGDKDNSTILKFVSPGNMIGVAGIFAPDPPRTQTFACGDGKSEMFFIHKNAFEALLDSDPAFRRNLVEFLADRITFLNSKIDCVTAGTSERKLALFIKSAQRDSDGRVLIGMSMTALARALDLSRASLYRAFDTLEEIGAVKRDGRIVTILSQEKINNLS